MGPDVKNVFNKLTEGEIELSSQEVALSEINKINKIANELSSDLKKHRDLDDRIDKLLSERLAIKKSGRGKHEDLKVAIDKVFDMADNLGVRRQVFNETAKAREIYSEWKKITRS